MGVQDLGFGVFKVSGLRVWGLRSIAWGFKAYGLGFYGSCVRGFTRPLREAPRGFRASAGSLPDGTEGDGSTGHEVQDFQGRFRV